MQCPFLLPTAQESTLFTEHFLETGLPVLLEEGAFVNLWSASIGMLSPDQARARNYAVRLYHQREMTF